LTGTNFEDVPSSSSLQLTQFSLATWFKTANNYGSSAFLVTKGSGIETAGNNNNYGIWMTSSETIRGGFETKSGTNYEATSSSKYNDGKWHYAVVTYDGSSTVRPYIDGSQLATKSTSGAIPDNTGTQRLRVGANSLTPNGFFTGNADEMRVWSRVLSAAEIAAQYNNGIYHTTGQLVHLPF
jgi:hypothetical protein